MKLRGRAVTVLVSVVSVCAFGLSPAAAATSTVAPAGVFSQPFVSGVSTPDGRGFWLAYADGEVTDNAHAGHYGDASNYELNAPIAAAATTPYGRGYWLGASDGGVFAFGNAAYLGSMGATHLNQPIVAMASTKTGKGYWLVASDGGVFTFGNAHFYGSTGNLSLNQPIVGMTTGVSGRGYRLVARDGGIFTFGGARYLGSLPGLGVNVSDVIGMASTPKKAGYWIAGADGDVYAFGNARPFGNYAASACDPVAAIFSNPHAQGYRLVTESGATIPFGYAPGGIHPTGTPLQCPPPNTPVDVVTRSGQIGPLQLGVSTEADVVAHLGTPDAIAIASVEAGYPNYQALGYDCSTNPDAIAMVFQPQVRGPYCQTIYYLNVDTHTLAGFDTISNRYATAAGTTVGMPEQEAASREGEGPETGCLSLSIQFGTIYPPDAGVETNIFMSASDTVGSIVLDDGPNSVGILFC